MGGKRIEIGHVAFSELLRIARQPFVEDDLDVPDIKAHIPSSALRNFDWKMYKVIQSVEWFVPEDMTKLSIELVVEHLQERIQEGDKQYSGYNVMPLVSAIASAVPERVPCDLQELPLSTAGRPLSRRLLGEYAKLSDNAFSEDAKQWLYFENSYLKLRKNRLESTRQDETSLGYLNNYIFATLPKALGKEAIPSKIPQFNRRYLERNGAPSLLDEFKHLTVEGQYGQLKNIDLFFRYLEHVSSSYDNLTGFKNPIHKLDYPKLRRSKGSKKPIFTGKYFPVFHSFLFAIQEFVWYVIEEQYDSISVHNDTYDTELFGFVPIFYVNNQLVPIKQIPTLLLGAHHTTHINGVPANLPNYQSIAQFCVAIETGLRHAHIQWLSLDSYETHVNRSEKFGVQKLLVNTDKTRREPWVSIVSHRVILVLDRLKHYTQMNDVSIKASWYNGNENSRFGKIRSLFCPCRYNARKRDSDTGDFFDDMGPQDPNVARGHYKNLIFFFDLMLTETKLLPSLCSVPAQAIALLKDGDWGKAFKLRKEYNCEFTPHGTRLSVASDKVKMLPPWMIMENITGHESLSCFAHYVKTDPDWLRSSEAQQGQALYSEEASELFASCQSIVIKTENTHSALRKAVAQDPSAAMADFGGLSLEDCPSRGTGIRSGLRVIKSIPPENIVVNATHICPYNNYCPDDVVSEFGEGKCGQCWYSIKTVDHLPRIAAKARDLAAQIKTMEGHIKEAEERGGQRNALGELERERKQIAAELSAWLVCHQLLNQTLSDIQNKKNFLIGKPDILVQQAKVQVLKSRQVNDFLLRIADAEDYQEYYTPQLKGQIRRVTNKLLAKAGLLDEIIRLADKEDLIGEFRGAVKSICALANISTAELLEEIDKPMVKAPTLPASLLLNQAE